MLLNVSFCKGTNGGWHSIVELMKRGPPLRIGFVATNNK